MTNIQRTPTTAALPRRYDDLAGWWSLLPPPGDYEAEAADLQWLQWLADAPRSPR